MKRIAVAGTILVVAAVAVGSATATRTHAAGTVTIRHAVKGCHTWAYAGSGWRARLSFKLDRGTRTLTVVDNDVMPHKLFQLRGPHATILHAGMNHMSAQATIRFRGAGTYVFGTKPGEDYKGMGNMKTVGEDNVLRMTIRVG
jgi:hypothetical protein